MTTVKNYLEPAERGDFDKRLSTREYFKVTEVIEDDADKLKRILVK